MKTSKLPRTLFVLIIISSLLSCMGLSLAFGQSRRQPPSSNEKKNKRPPDPGQQGDKPEEPLPQDIAGKPQEAEKITVTTQIVNVDAVVYHKKSGQIVTGLKKENFAIFADNAPETITNFSTPEAPITVAMVVEYSKWSEIFGYYGSPGFDPGTYEVIRPVAMLKEKGISVSEPVYHQWMNSVSVYFDDPDGHALELLALSGS